MNEKSSCHRTVSAIIVLFACIVSLSACSRGNIKTPINKAAQKNDSAEAFVHVNQADPGQDVNVQQAIVFGKYTIIDFTSPYCIACQQITPYLEHLHAVRPDVVVRSYDVNRPKVEGIDWESPLATKYGIHQLPAFRIYNEKGVLIADGNDASEQVRQLVQDEIVNGKPH